MCCCCTSSSGIQADHSDVYVHCQEVSTTKWLGCLVFLSRAQTVTSDQEKRLLHQLREITRVMKEGRFTDRLTPEKEAEEAPYMEDWEGKQHLLISLLAASPEKRSYKNFLIWFYLFIFRGEGKEKERERNINVWLPLTRPLLGAWLATQACALTGNQTGDSLVCRTSLYPLSYTCQGKKWF